MNMYKLQMMQLIHLLFSEMQNITQNCFPISSSLCRKIFYFFFANFFLIHLLSQIGALQTGDPNHSDSYNRAVIISLNKEKVNKLFNGHGLPMLVNDNYLKSAIPSEWNITDAEGESINTGVSVPGAGYF